jgi:hypothetical protein
MQSHDRLVAKMLTPVIRNALICVAACTAATAAFVGVKSAWLSN